MAFRQYYIAINCFIFSTQLSLTCTTAFLPTSTIPRSDNVLQVFSWGIYIDCTVYRVMELEDGSKKNLPKHQKVIINMKSNLYYKLIREFTAETVAVMIRDRMESSHDPYKREVWGQEKLKLVGHVIHIRHTSPASTMLILVLININSMTQVTFFFNTL